MRLKRTGISRRRFMGAAAAAAAISIVPRHVLGQGLIPPSEKITLAGIGVGGQGGGDLGGFAGAEIIALCDVDIRNAAESFRKYPNARQFRDFRQMFAEMEKQVDAVLVATPDHTHSVAVMAALKRRKHVYCEKPLCHSIWEVREVMKAAREANVVTQMGNQGHSTDSIRRFCEWIWDGAIGNVQTAHLGCNWSYSKIDDLPKLAEKHEIPPTLDWDLWLGPAQYRPYHPMYQPFNWRGWMPFGTGVIGDWACHVFDPVYWALDLGAPATIQATAPGYDPVKHADTLPKGTTIKYVFPATARRGPVTVWWRDGDAQNEFLRTGRPAALEASRKMPEIGGIILGDKGGIMHGSHGASDVRLFPESAMKSYKQPKPTIARAREHHQEWLACIREGRKAGSDFADFGGPLAQVGLLGVIAIKCLGQELHWDAAAMRFTNSDEANRHIKPTFREGWTL